MVTRSSAAGGCSAMVASKSAFAAFFFFRRCRDAARRPRPRNDGQGAEPLRPLTWLNSDLAAHAFAAFPQHHEMIHPVVHKIPCFLRVPRQPYRQGKSQHWLSRPFVIAASAELARSTVPHSATPAASEGRITSLGGSYGSHR